MKKVILVIFTLLELLHFIESRGQDITIPKSASFREIHDLIKPVYLDTLLSLRYIEAYKKKALKEKNALQLGKALTWQSYYEPDEIKKIKLLDSAINLTKGLNSKNYPILSYTSKGGHFLITGQYDKALKTYLKTLELAKDKGNTYYEYAIKHNIAIIKGEIGRNEEALEIFEECLAYERIVSKEKNSIEYVESLLKTGEYFLKTNQPNSAKPLLDEGLLKSNSKYPILNSQTRLQLGIYELKRGKLILAEDILNSGLSKLNKSHPDLIKTHILYLFYLGKIKENTGNLTDALYYFKKMDSVSKLQAIRAIETRAAYYTLISHYQEANDLKNQLLFTNRLLEFDSINNSNGISLSKTLKEGFDTPILLEQRDNIIYRLEKDKEKASFLSISFFVLALVLIGVLMLMIRRKNILESRFQILLSSSSENTKKIFKVTPEEDKKISENVIQNILVGLEKFEKELEFLNNDLKSDKLAKSLKTNSKYLSVVLNRYKKTSYSNYIKDLRIDYAIKELQTNLSLRNKYTIDAISKEVGFNNAESFSLAFKKKTGLNPSYFIKKLNQKQV